MNIRPLASSGKQSLSSKSISSNKQSTKSSSEIERSQVEYGRAKASWGKSIDRSVSFDQNGGVGGVGVSGGNSARSTPTQRSAPLTPLSPSGSFRMTSPAKPPTAVSPVKASQKQSFAQEALDVNDGEDDEGKVHNLDLPAWQMDLYDIFFRTNGDNWKQQGGWPSQNMQLKEEDNDQDSKDKNNEIYGVGRPYNQPSEVLSIDLCWNNLSGDIGQLEGLWKIKHLEILQLGANKLTGIIPGYELRRLVLLKELHLYRNGLHGHIPNEIGQLRQLSSLWLFENHFTGKLPDSLGELSSLTDLRCNSNRLSGPLPVSLSQCNYLKTLNLQKNNFTGTVTEEIIMNCHRLRDLRLWDNKFTGALTAEINCLRFLEVLLLQQNELSWIIPPTLGKCEHLVKVDLSKNKFRGELPKIGTLQKLEYLNVSNNTKISGRILRDIQQLPKLTFIDVSSTMLSDKEEFARAMKQGRTAALKPVEVIIDGFEVSEE